MNIELTPAEVSALKNCITFELELANLSEWDSSYVEALTTAKEKLDASEVEA